MTDAGPSAGGWDVHTHIVPPGVVAAAERGAFGMARAGGKLSICAHGVPLHPISEVPRLVARIADDGLDGAVVSVPPPLFRPDLARSDRRDYARLVNASLREACERYPRVLRPLAYLPVEEPELAAATAAELDEHWAGVVMGTQMEGHSYASPALDPLWTILSARNLPLFIHPGSTPDPRLDPYYLTNLLGNPVETTIAASHLVFAGVLERLPRLTVILAHGGGCVAALCGRWQRGTEIGRADIPRNALRPLDAVRRFYVDSLVHSPAYLDAVIDTIGADRVLLGSDWPFPMGAPSADHDIGRLDPALRHQIRVLNAERAYRGRLRVDQATTATAEPHTSVSQERS